jgi:hypothetical protein
MKEHGLGFFALESVVAILQALDVLEIGEVCVAAMRDRLNIVHGFHERYTRQKAAFVVSSFHFDYNELNSADYVPTCPNFSLCLAAWTTPTTSSNSSTLTLAPSASSSLTVASTRPTCSLTFSKPPTRATPT